MRDHEVLSFSSECFEAVWSKNNTMKALDDSSTVMRYAGFAEKEDKLTS